MKNNMLWFDNTVNRTLHEKIKRAVMRFFEKFGQYPDTCYAHPYTLGELAHRGMLEWKLGGVDFDHEEVLVTVVPSNMVLPYHFYLEVVDK